MHRSVVALLLVSALFPETRAGAQSAPAVESEPPLVVEPGAPALPDLDFDRDEFALAQRTVLKTRNWFLGSAAVFGVGWILLGTGIGQCQEFGGVDECTGRGDRLSRAGMTIVFVGSLAVLSTSITYAVRARQKRRFEQAMLEYLTQGRSGLPPLAFDEYRLADAKDRSRRARNGLIGSTAMFAVGSIFLGLAIPRCEAGNGRLLCTDPGYAHFTIGMTVAGSGAIGMIVSGALLGVRNSNKRSLERWTRQRQGAGLRWDPASRSFVF